MKDTGLKITASLSLENNFSMASTMFTVFNFCNQKITSTINEHLHFTIDYHFIFYTKVSKKFFFDLHIKEKNFFIYLKMKYFLTSQSRYFHYISVKIIEGHI